MVCRTQLLARNTVLSNSMGGVAEYMPSQTPKLGCDFATHAGCMPALLFMEFGGCRGFCTVGGAEWRSPKNLDLGLFASPRT